MCARVENASIHVVETVNKPREELLLEATLNFPKAVTQIYPLHANSVICLDPLGFHLGYLYLLSEVRVGSPISPLRETVNKPTQLFAQVLQAPPCRSMGLNAPVSGTCCWIFFAALQQAPIALVTAALAPKR